MQYSKKFDKSKQQLRYSPQNEKKKVNGQVPERASSTQGRENYIKTHKNP